MKKKKWKKMDCGTGSGGAIYGLGFVGAAVFYLQQATTVWEGIIGILKAIVWPAFLIHKVLNLLGM